MDAAFSPHVALCTMAIASLLGCCCRAGCRMWKSRIGALAGKGLRHGEPRHCVGPHQYSRATISEERGDCQKFYRIGPGSGTSDWFRSRFVSYKRVNAPCPAGSACFLQADIGSGTNRTVPPCDSSPCARWHSAQPHGEVFQATLLWRCVGSALALFAIKAARRAPRAHGISVPGF